MNKEIEWGPLIDKHCRGKSIFGDIWIRTDKNGKVTSLYTMWPEAEKYVPESEEEETLEGAKIIAAILVDNKIEQIVLKNKLLKNVVEQTKRKGKI